MFIVDISQRSLSISSQIRSKRTLQIMAIISIIFYAAAILCRFSYGYPHYNKIYDVQYSTGSIRHLIPTPSNEVTTSNKELHKAVHIREDAGHTITPKPTTIQLDDIFVAVKTTKLNHAKRVDIIAKTWFQIAPRQTWFFTDADDNVYTSQLNKHLINTKCPRGHSRRALCCKMAAELITFLQHRKKWFCHFDDDNYVNIHRLQQFLSDYDASLDWYIGKPSTGMPLEISPNEQTERGAQFWFATGGAGFCISRPLVTKMLPFLENGNLVKISDRIRFPDDVTIGFIIENLLKVQLTVVDKFHSHLEPLDQIHEQSLDEQISFSYAQENNIWNVVNIDGLSEHTDPTRFMSIHCHLYPYAHSCSQKRKHQ